MAHRRNSRSPRVVRAVSSERRGRSRACSTIFLRSWGGRLHRVREDFCGTGQFSAAWAKSDPTRSAIGVDLDKEVLEWGRGKLSERLDEEAQKRVELLEGDVLKVTGDPVDAVLATNFSYYLFKTRSELKNYFATARKHIRPGGIFIMDAYGGSESFEEQEEERDLDGFIYVWDQNHYNPITGDVINHIHFRFPDGTELNKAFTYEWRLWTLPELQELLIEAGFQSVNVYWEGTIEEGDEAGEGDGEFKQTRVGEACQGGFLTSWPNHEVCFFTSRTPVPRPRQITPLCRSLCSRG